MGGGRVVGIRIYRQVALLDRYRYAISILIKEHRPLGPFQIVFTFVLIDRHSLSSERRAQISLSDFTHFFGYFFSTFSSCSADIFIYIRTLRYLFTYIRTVELHGRFADVFGRFLHHHHLQSGRQTDRLLLSGDLRIWRLSVYFFGI